MMVVAYYIAHNDGTLAGILNDSDQELTLADLYEVDGTVRTFNYRDEAEAWLRKRRAHV